MKAIKVFETINFTRGGTKSTAEKIGIGVTALKKNLNITFDGTFGI